MGDTGHGQRACGGRHRSNDYRGHAGSGSRGAGSGSHSSGRATRSNQERRNKKEPRQAKVESDENMKLQERIKFHAGNCSSEVWKNEVDLGLGKAGTKGDTVRH